MTRIQRIISFAFLVCFTVACEDGPNFFPTAPSVVQENGSVASGSSVSGTSSVNTVGLNCGNPNDNLPDDGANGPLQVCLDGGRRIELSAGNPGYIVNVGLILRVPGTVFTSGGNGMAKIIAGRDLFAPILQTTPHQEVNNFTIDQISFDGKVDDMAEDGAYRRRRDDCGPGGAPGNIILRGNRFRFINNESKNALCGSGLGLAGNFEVQNNFISSNGRDIYSGAPGYPWADGMTVLSCDGGYIGHNTIVDNTDIDLVSGGGKGCVVEINPIKHLTKYGFCGLGIGNFQGPSAGDHSGSEYRGNTVNSRGPNKLSMGICAGSHMWSVSTNVFNVGKVVGNTVVGASIGIVVDGVFGGEISGNDASDSLDDGTGEGVCRRSGHNYTVYPPHAKNTILQGGWIPLRYDYNECRFGGDFENKALRLGFIR